MGWGMRVDACAGIAVVVAVAGWLCLLHHAPCTQVARSLVLMSRYVSAIDVYDQIISKGARDWHVLHNRSICLSHIGRVEEAKVCLREVWAISTFPPHGWCARSVSFMCGGGEKVDHDTFFVADWCFTIRCYATTDPRFRLQALSLHKHDISFLQVGFFISF